MCPKINLGSAHAAEVAGLRQDEDRGQGPSVPAKAFDVGPHESHLGVSWAAGASSYSSSPGEKPLIQVHWFDEDTVIMRQNMTVHYEAPFMYLLFGRDRVLLLDTGATASAQYFPLRETVDELITQWSQDHGQRSSRPLELLILHSHSHHDHVAGDAQFFDRPMTTIVPADDYDARKAVGIPGNEVVIGSIDLGDRVLSVMSTPGHDSTAITLWDAATNILLTGDTVYPGRLYINNWAAFRRTIDRLVEFAADHPIHYVLGGHIEMTSTPGVDYPRLTTYQPQETRLEMGVEHLVLIQHILNQNATTPRRLVSGLFILSPEFCSVDS